EVLPELNRSLQLTRQLSVARNIVVASGFLKPIEPLVVERVASHERVTQRQALVEVTHELHCGANRLPHGGNSRQIVGERFSSQSELQAGEPSFSHTRRRLSG